MKKTVGSVLLLLASIACTFGQVDSSYIFNTQMPYGTLDLRIARSATRYYYLQENTTFSFRESSPGVKTNTYYDMTSWDSSPYRQGNLREKNGSLDQFVMNYRLLFPVNYNATFPDGYPLILMLHGAGEAGNCWDDDCYWATPGYNPNTNNPPAPTNPDHELLNNDRNLFHGGSQHLAAVNLAGGRLPNDPTMPTRAFPGFVVFPQSLNGWSQPARVEDAIRIVRLLMKKYNIDENRIYIHGLSNGGGGVNQAIKRAPWMFAAALTMSAISNAEIPNNNLTDEVARIPLWIFQGGQDKNPTPGKTFSFVKALRSAGGVVRYYLYPSLGHATWNSAYKEPDFFSWMLANRKYNMHISYGNPVICNTTGAGVRFSFSNGFFAYQWEKDGQIIPNSNAYIYVVGAPGTYRGRFSRRPNPGPSDWEPWSAPVVVSEINPAQPAIRVSGTTHLRGPGLASNDANNRVVLEANVQAELYEWYRNGQKINFNFTDIDDTLRRVTLTSSSNASNGAYTLLIRNSNCPSPPSEPVQLFFNNSAPQNLVIASTAVQLQGKATNSSVFLTWKDVLENENGYEIWRRKLGTADFRFVARTNPNQVSYLDSNLEPSTTYEYKLRAINNAGRSNYVPGDAVTSNYQITTEADYSRPTPPQNLRIVNNTINSITLAWDAASDNAGIQSYAINYNGLEVSVPATTLKYTLNGLAANTKYAIYVRAKDYANLLSQASNQVLGNTYVLNLTYKHSTGAWLDLDEPTLTATWINPEFTGTINNFSLAPRTQEDFYNFQFTGFLRISTTGVYTFRTTSDDGSRLLINGAVVVDNDGKHGNRTITGAPIELTAGFHPIEVQYFDNTGNQNLVVQYQGPGIGNGGTFLTIPDDALRSGIYSAPTPPQSPANVAATEVAFRQVQLSWTFNDDEQTDFEIYRATSSNGPFEIAVRSQGTPAIDSISIKANTTYFYRLKTVNLNGSSSFSDIVSVTTSPDNLPPTAPTSLSLLNKSGNTAVITWLPSIDNVGVVEYEVFANGIIFGSTTERTFSANNLESLPYTFSVRAVDATGNRSAFSNNLLVDNTIPGLYYCLANGDLAALETWKKFADGTGPSPTDFTAPGQTFVLSKRSQATLATPWNITGAGSKLVVPAGVTLTLQNACNCTIELQGNSTLNLQHPSIPTFSDISAASTIHFDANNTIPKNTYGNVIVSGTDKTIEGDTITVLGNLTLNGTAALKSAPTAITTVKIFGNAGLNSSTPDINHTAHLFFTRDAFHTLSFRAYAMVHQLSAGENATIDINSNAAVKISVGGPGGGGIAIGNNSLISFKNNQLLVRENGAINEVNSNGRIGFQDGAILFVTNSLRNSNLFFDTDANSISKIEINQAGAGVIALKSPVLVNQSVKIQAGILGSDGNLTLAGAIVQAIEGNGEIRGRVHVQQFIPASSPSWISLGSPVKSESVADLQQSIPVTGNFAGASTQATMPSLFYFDGSAQLMKPFPANGGANSATLTSGLAHRLYLYDHKDSAATVVTRSGILNQRTISFPIAKTTGTGGAAWNFLGNPYASPIQWKMEGWRDTGISNIIAVPRITLIDGEYHEQYSYYDRQLDKVTLVPGQTFWIQSGTPDAILEVTELAKVSGGGTPGQIDRPNTLTIALEKDGQEDRTHIRILEQASAQYDYRNDGAKLRNKGLFNLSSIIGDTLRAAVNSMPPTACNTTVRLAIENASPGNYQLKFLNRASFEDMEQIVLVDKFTNQTFDIADNSFSFSITEDPNSSGFDRFAIQFIKTRLDVDSPTVAPAVVCLGNDALIAIDQAQPDVVYSVVNVGGTVIGSQQSSSTNLQITIPQAELAFGDNTFRIQANLPGCAPTLLKTNAVVTYTDKIQLQGPADVLACAGSPATLTTTNGPANGSYQWRRSDGTVVAGVNGPVYEISAPATNEIITVFAESQGCSSDTLQIRLTVQSLDIPVISQAGDTLSVMHTSGSYQWYKDDVMLEGDTLNYILPQEEGLYTVRITQGPCEKTSDEYRFSNSVTGLLPDIGLPFTLEVYPNPVEWHNINMRLSTGVSALATIEILNTTGQKLHQAEVVLGNGTTTYEIHLQKPLPDGVYMVVARQKEQRIVKRFVVKGK